MEFTNSLPFRYQREPNSPKPLQVPSAADAASTQDAERVMALPPSSNSIRSPSPRPRTPLPPHKLAKIANALGVSTPMPAFYRSPSPSGISPLHTPSRYLLHVVPPQFLPLDDDDDGSDPEGTGTVSASVYRSQFRRGTLIPLYPTLQSQLGAIAREYNLPSTGGLVLYLVHSQSAAADGPRISDDVWKLLWHKALHAERKDSQAHLPNSFDFRTGYSTPLSPFPQGHRDAVRDRDASHSLSSTVHSPSSPFPYPSPSTSSTPSPDIHLPLSSQSHASSPDLPTTISDLTPNPFLPILAKVEFDIDRRKAGWYDTWLHGRRERSRWRAGTDGGKIQLSLPQRTQSRDRFRTDLSHGEDSNEYALLDDGEGEQTAVDDDDQEPTVVLHRRDPLADVFGNDATTWRELHAGREAASTTLSHPELVIPPGGEAEHEPDEPHDTDDVVKIWNENHRPRLPLDPPDLRRKGAPKPLNLASPSKSKTSPLSPSIPTANSALPYLKKGSLDPSVSSELHDKKTRRRTGMIFGDLEVKIVSEPDEMSEAELSSRHSSQILMKEKLDQLEKQLAVLSPRQFTKPHPLSHSTLGPTVGSEQPPRSAPPGINQFNITPPRHKVTTSISSSPRKQDTLSPVISVGSTLPDPFQVPPRKESLLSPRIRSPRKEHRRGQGSQSSSGSSSKNLPEPPVGNAVWPAVAYSSLMKAQPPIPPSPTTRPNAKLQDRSPPQLTLKRATQNPVDVSEETRVRTHDLDDGQDVLLPTLPVSGNPGSPVIPLSPDPFGKRPVEDMRQARHSGESNRSVSNGSRSSSRLQGTVLPASVPEEKEMDAQSSRFSADSIQSVEQLTKQRRSRSNSIMSVRSLRNLWRKSNAPGRIQAGDNVMPPLPSPSSASEMSPLSPALPQSRPPSQHFRGESIASQRGPRPVERAHRPSASQRPDSGSDPFQFDNANIYKSPSSSSLVSGATPTAPNYAATGGSIGQSKGILKGWNGNTNPPEAETRRVHRPSAATLQRSMSTASTATLDLDDVQSPSLVTAPDTRRIPSRNGQHLQPEPLMTSHSLPTALLSGLSRYPDGSPSTSSATGDGSAPRLSEFEIISPLRSAGLTPSASYTGEISR